MKQKFTLMLNVTAAGALVLGAAGCGRGKGGPPVMPPASVTLATVVAVDTPVEISGFGTTEDRATVDIVPQVSGLLQSTAIQDGAVVTNEQPLFYVDASDYAARVKQAEGMVAANRADLDLSRQTLTRNAALLEKKLISAEQYDTLKTRVTASEAQLAMNEAALELARLSLARCTIRAPFAGVCSKRLVDDGTLLAAGMTRLINIRSYDPLDVEFSVPEQHLGALREARAKGPVKVEILPRGDTNLYTGSLSFIDNAVNPLTGTILLRAQVPNPELRLWSRQFVEVHVESGVIPGALMVPESAVQFGKLGPYVFAVTAESKADLRPVQTGIRHDDMIQIVRGVQAGDRVVVHGQLLLYPGAAVAEAKAAPAQPGAPAGDAKPAAPAAGGGAPDSAKDAKPAAHS